MRKRDRIFHSYAEWVARRPRAIVFGCILSALICLPIALSRFRITADQDALLDDRVPYHKRYLEYLEDFGDQEYIYIVLENLEPAVPGQEPQSVDLSRLKSLADTIGAFLQARPELYEQVVFKVDPEIFLSNALLFLSEEQILEIEASLAELDPMLENLGGDPGPVGVLRAMARELQRLPDQAQSSTTPDSERGERLFKFLTGYLDELARAAVGETISEPQALKELFPRSELDETEDDRDGYFVAENKELLFLLVLPVKDYDGDMAVITEPLNELRAFTEELQQRHPDIPIGVTGRPVLQADEMWTTDADTRKAGLLSFLGVALITFVIFGNFGRPLLMLLSLAVGLSWSFLAATLLVNALNLLSMVFAAVLVGLGIDFAVHIVVRYQEALVQTGQPVAALKRSLTTSAVGNLTGAVSSALGFYGTLFTNFSGLGELGLVAGTGVLLCLLSSLTVLPALLLVYDGGKGGVRAVKPLRNIPIRIRRPGLVLIAACLASVALAYPLDRLRYDSNILKLQAKGLDSVEWERRILEDSKRSSWYSVVYAESLQRARILADSLAALSTVGKVESPSDFVPDNQVAKIELVRRLFKPYSNLPELAQPAPVALDAFEAAAEELLEELDGLQALTMEWTDLEARAQALEAITELIVKVEVVWEGAPDARQTTLDLYARSFRDALAERLELLEKSSVPTGLSLELLPPPLDTRFVGKSGRYGVIVYPDVDVWNPESLAVHVAQVRTVDPLIVGVTVQIHESTELIREAFLEALGYALIAVTLLLWIDLRSLPKALLALIPLAVGIFWLLCAMAWLGYNFNLANFFAVPILVGIGVDGGVHLIHRFGECGEIDLTRSSTGTSVLAAALTTVFGFGSLTIASHEGLSSLGALLGIGAFTCLLAALFVLPTLLHLFYGRRAGDPTAQPS